MSPPNLLTLSRLPLALVIWVNRKRRRWIVGTMVAAGITDILDGWLARRMKIHHPAGVWLDPLCDKIFVLAAIAAVSSIRQPAKDVPFLIASRELTQLPFVVLYVANRFARKTPLRHVNLQSARIGKLTTFTQFLAIGSLLLRHRWTRPLSTLAGILGLGASSFYVHRTFRVLLVGRSEQTHRPLNSRIKKSA